MLDTRRNNVLHSRYTHPCSKLTHVFQRNNPTTFPGSSIAEIVSAFPTCGGLYTASAQLCPRKRRPIVGWVVGWLNILGQVAGVSSTEFGLANMIWAAVSIAKVTPAIHPITKNTGQSRTTTFYITGWQTHHQHRQERWLVFWSYDPSRSPRERNPSHPPSTLTVSITQNCLSTKYLAKLTSGFVFVNLGATCSRLSTITSIFHPSWLSAVIIIVLLATTPRSEMHSASYVFGSEGVINSTGGWPSGIAFLLGLLSVQWTMTDYDASARKSFELHHYCFSDRFKTSRAYHTHQNIFPTTKLFTAKKSSVPHTRVRNILNYLSILHSRPSTQLPPLSLLPSLGLVYLDGFST